MALAGVSHQVSLAIYLAVPGSYFVLVALLWDRPATASGADDFSSPQRAHSRWLCAVASRGTLRATSLDSCFALSSRFWQESRIDAANDTTMAVVRAVHGALERAGIGEAQSLEIALVDAIRQEASLLALLDTTSPADD